MVNGLGLGKQHQMNPAQMAMMQHAQQQAAEQQVGVYIGQTCIAIYANLVSDMVREGGGKRPSQERMREAAVLAKDCAQYPAEAVGMVRIKDENPKDE